jgi:hypothetical protein
MQVLFLSFGFQCFGNGTTKAREKKTAKKSYVSIRNGKKNQIRRGSIIIDSSIGVVGV